MPCFKAHQPTPPSSSPPASEPSVTCHVSKLTNGPLSLPPPLLVHPHLQCAMFLSSPTHSSLFLPSSESLLAMCHVSELTNLLLPLSPFQQVSPFCTMPHFQAYQPTPPSSSPPASESPFCNMPHF